MFGSSQSGVASSHHRSGSPTLTLQAISVAALIIVVWLLFFAHLGSVPIYTRGEAREAVQVVDEVERGEWVLPLRNGVEIPSKPPLFHWLGGLAALVHGRVDELAVRLPSALLAALTVLAIFWVASQKWSVEAGVSAALMLATNFEWMRAARSARVDMTLAASLTTSLLAADKMVAEPRPSAAALGVFYVGMGLAALSKGPVGLVLPPLAVLGYLALSRDLARVRFMRPLLGLTVALLIPACWYAGAIYRGGRAFVEKQLLRENVLRFLGTGGMKSSHPHSFFYYVHSFLAGFFPWSLFLVPLSVQLAKNRRELMKRGYLFPLVWFTTVFVFYSVASGKRTVYILPAYPAAALMVGAWWAESGSDQLRQSRVLRACFRLAAVLVAAAAAAVVFVSMSERSGLHSLDWAEPFLHPRDRANLPLARAVLLAHSFQIRLWMGGMVAAGVLGVVGSWRRSAMLVFQSLTACVIATILLVNASFVPALAERRSAKKFMSDVCNLVGPDDSLVFYRMFDYGVVFYARRHIPVFEDASSLDRTEKERRYILLWESTWSALDPGVRRELIPVLRSDDEPRKNDHLLLVRDVPASDSQNSIANEEKKPAWLSGELWSTARYSTFSAMKGSGL